jgi:hypothetical protein
MFQYVHGTRYHKNDIYEELMHPQNAIPTIAFPSSFADKPPSISDILPAKAKAQHNKKKEQDMCYHNAPPVIDNRDHRTEAQQAKDYLIKSLEEVTRKQKEDLLNQFGLTFQRPETIGELREWIKKGWVFVDTIMDDEDEIYSATEYVSFGDPEKKRDIAGYRNAMKQMTKDASDVKDQIVVFGPEKGLEALNAFKEKTYQ